MFHDRAGLNRACGSESTSLSHSATGCEGGRSFYRAKPRLFTVLPGKLLMRRSLAVLLLLATLLPAAGCSRNREIPVELAPSRTTAIGVNSYLWRAAIDTLSFAPLVSADSNG